MSSNYVRRPTGAGLFALGVTVGGRLFRYAFSARHIDEAGEGCLTMITTHLCSSGSLSTPRALTTMTTMLGRDLLIHKRSIFTLCMNEIHQLPAHSSRTALHSSSGVPSKLCAVEVAGRQRVDELANRIVYPHSALLQVKMRALHH